MAMRLGHPRTDLVKSVSGLKLAIIDKKLVATCMVSRLVGK